MLNPFAKTRKNAYQVVPPASISHSSRPMVYRTLDWLITDPVFVVPDHIWEDMYYALKPITRMDVEISGFSWCEYFGKAYKCIAYKGKAFIKLSEVKNE